MADQVKLFKNNISTGGLTITEATPIDDRLIVLDEATIIDVFSAPYTTAENDFRAVLYDGMVIKSAATENSYVWKESSTGLLGIGYTYPDYDQDYGGKTYNFVRKDRVIVIEKTYVNASIPGLDIPDSVLPYSVLQNKEAANVVFKSDGSGFLELEYPDRVEVTATGIMIILDPLPFISEQFKIIIS